MKNKKRKNEYERNYFISVSRILVSVAITITVLLLMYITAFKLDDQISKNKAVEVCYAKTNIATTSARSMILKVEPILKSSETSASSSVKETMKVEKKDIEKEAEKDFPKGYTPLKNQWEETVYLTFYCGVNNSMEGGKKNAMNFKLADGQIAVGKKFIADGTFRYGDILYIEGYGNCIVTDCGSSREIYLGDPDRIDVYIPRKDGESDSEWLDRINSMGSRVEANAKHLGHISGFKNIKNFCKNSDRKTMDLTIN